MLAMLKEPGRAPVKIEIENTLDALRGIIGGHIEHVGFDLFDYRGGHTKIGILMDEEGKLKGLPPNFSFFGDSIVGTVLIVGEDGEGFIDLTEEQCLSVRARFPGNE